MAWNTTDIQHNPLQSLSIPQSVANTTRDPHFGINCPSARICSVWNIISLLFFFALKIF